MTDQGPAANFTTGSKLAAMQKVLVLAVVEKLLGKQ